MGLFRRKKTDPALKPTSAADALRIKNILAINQLESMPLHAARAFQLAADPKAAASDFVHIIEQDEALSSRVIRIANSVYFFRGSSANDIEKAVANIGLNELRCLLAATMLRSILKGKQELRRQVWANAVGTGIACRLLAPLTEQASEGELFLAGLVHDIGKLIMLQRNPDLFEKAQSLVIYGEATVLEAEEQTFEVTHPEVGKWAAEEWNFPPTAIIAISKHHNPWPETAPKQPNQLEISTLVKAADTLAHAAGIGHSARMHRIRAAAEEQLKCFVESCGVEEEIIQRKLEELVQRYSDEAKMYEADSKP